MPGSAVVDLRLFQYSDFIIPFSDFPPGRRRRPLWAGGHILRIDLDRITGLTGFFSD
jgi:hypothetical protein